MADALVRLATATTVSAALIDPATDLPLTTGTVTVVVTRNGTTVHTLTATQVGSTNVWSIALPAQATLGELVCNWPDEPRIVEVVGSLPITRSRVRREEPFNDTAKWPNWKLDIAIADAVDELEDMLGVAPCRRRATEKHIATCGRPIRLTRVFWDATGASLVSINLNGTDMDPADVATIKIDSVGRLTRTFSDRDALTITLDFGDPTVTDSSLLTALARRTRHMLSQSKSAVPERTERSYIDQSGRTVFLASAGKRRTGLPDVDAVYGRKSRKHGLLS